MIPQGATNPPGPHPHSPPHFEPLRWIGAYRLLKSALAMVGGLLVLRLEHRNLPTVALRWLNRLHIAPHSRFGHLVLHHVLEIRPSRMTWAAAFLFTYAAVGLVEGLGLIFRKTWAEWLTVVTTSLLIPVEVWRLARRPDWAHVLIILLNVAVVAYLVWRIRRDQNDRRLRKSSAGGGPAAPPTR